MAHTRVHKEQIQTAPSFVEQLRDAISRRAASFGQQQEEGISAFQRGDPGMFPGTFNPGGGEEFLEGSAGDLLSGLTRAIGGGEQEQQASRLLPMLVPFIAPGIIKTNLKLRDFLNLQKSRKAIEGPIGKRVTKIGKEMAQTINISKSKLDPNLAGFTRTVRKGQPGVPTQQGCFVDGAFSNPAHFDFDIVINAERFNGGPLEDLVKRQIPIGGTQLHESFHDMTAPLISVYGENLALQASLSEAAKALPLQIQDLIAKAPGGKLGRITEKFARIMDMGNTVSAKAATGVVITRAERQVLQMADELVTKAARVQGVDVSDIKVLGLESSSLLTTRAHRSVGNESKVRAILTRMDDKDRFIDETNKAVDKFLKESK